MKAELITEESDFLALEPIWNPLLQTSGANYIFLTFEWLSTWWHHLGKNSQLFILLVKNQDRIVGALPLIIRYHEGFRQLSNLGGPTVDYTDFIIAGDQDRGAVIETILNAVVKEKSWDFLRLKGLREDSPNLRPIREILSKFAGYKPLCFEYNIAPYIPIDRSWEDYWDGLSNSFRKDSERKLRRLKRDKGVVTYHEAADQNTVELYMDKLIENHISRWKESLETYSFFEDPAVINFYKDLVRKFFIKKWLRLTSLLIEGDIGAVYLGLEYGNKYYYYTPTFSSEFYKYSTGRLLLIHKLEDSFSKNLNEFDFLLGDESYKFDFNPKVQKLFSLALFQRSLKGYASEMWFQRIRPGLGSLIENSKYLNRVNSWLLRAGIRKKFGV